MEEAKRDGSPACPDLQRILKASSPQEWWLELRDFGKELTIGKAISEGDRIAFERLQFLEAQEQSAEIEDWKRTRLAIEHENSLVNYRLTWLFTVQLVFLAFFAGIFGALVEGKVAGFDRFEAVGLLALIAILSQVFSIVVYGAINGARIQLDRLDSWWRERPKKLLHPDLQFWEPSHPFGFHLTDGLIPIWFFYLWALLNGFVIFDLASLALGEGLYRPVVFSSAAIAYAIQGIAAVEVSRKIFQNEQERLDSKAQRLQQTAAKGYNALGV